MNPSGSEFTLRVAICDLVERLKRMQHKCTYLEECRNQLVKEVIRLRLQNEWLAKQISDSPGASSSLPQNLQCFCNQQQSLVNSQYHTPHCHMSGHETNSANEPNNPTEVDLLCMNHKSNGPNNNDESLHLMNILSQFEQEDLDNKQDSIKNLTIQMLKDLEVEMKTGRLKSDLIKFVKNSSATAQGIGGDPYKDDLMKFDDEEELIDNHAVVNSKLTPAHSANYEAFNNNSDYYTDSHNLNLAFDDLQLQMYAQNSSNKSNCKEGDSLSNRPSTGKKQPRTDIFQTTREDNKSKVGTAAKQLNGTEKAATDPSDPSELTNLNHAINRDNSPLLGSYDLNLKDEELANIIRAVKNDLKGLQAGVLASTDKLNKIKSRHLRYFFQKQINLENSTKSKQTGNLSQSHSFASSNTAANNNSLK